MKLEMKQMTEDEIYEALSSLKGNKAGGKNGVLPEMVKSCGWHDGLRHGPIQNCVEKVKSLLNGRMLCWSQFQRKETSQSVTTGVVSACWL